MSRQPFRELTDDDIRQMAREAEAENLRLHPAHRKPRGWHYRRASIMLGLLPLEEITLEELVWHLSDAMARSE
jgi:hypothetical protein